ncbi:MAG: ABC transporter permease subunit [Chitinophagaceae bacterium]|nr:ABC transporter permease subunit [Chitinophagaceae bacterium]
MSTIKTIIIYEWLQLKRSRTLWLLTLIFSVISIYAAWYGRSEVKEQQRKIALLQDSVAVKMNVLSRELLQHDSTAWEYDPLYKTVFYNRPDGIAALAFGQRDLHKFAIEISEGTYYYNKYATGYSNKTLSGEITNPQKQLAGHLDLSFVIVFLLPLYFILLSYNILSAEKEEGTLPLLAVQAVSTRKIFFAKLFVRWLITTMLAILLLLTAALITGAVTDARIFLFIAATMLYSVVWAGVVSLVVSFKKASGFNALFLISTWLVFGMLLPAAFNAFLTAKYPAINKIALASAVQKANVEVFGIPRIAVADSFYAMHPQYNNLPGDTLPGGWYNPRWIRATHAVLDNKVQRVETPYLRVLEDRIRTAGKFNYCSPALLMQSILTGAAASDHKQIYAFDTASWHYFKTWNSYLDDRIFFKNNRFTKADFDNLPVYTFKPVVDYRQVVFSLLVLLATGLVLLAVSLLRLSAPF